jgi:hypothetical protein
MEVRMGAVVGAQPSPESKGMDLEIKAKIADIGRHGFEGALLFEPLYISDLPLVVDPHDTCARRCCGPRVSRAFERLNEWRAYSVFSVFASIFTGLSMILSITGKYVEIGWAAPANVLVLIPVVAVMNVPMIGKLCRTFDLWFLTSSSLIATMCWADMVWTRHPARLCAVLSAGTVWLALPFLDARRFTVSIVSKVWITVFSTSLVSLVFLGMWWAGSWEDIDQRTILIRNVEIHVPSLGMSAYTTLSVFRLQFAWRSFLARHDGEPLVMLRPKAVYRVIIPPQRPQSEV